MNNNMNYEEQHNNKESNNNAHEVSKIYKYIVHLSDIHIRLNSRLEEYEHVFSNLYKKLDSYNDPESTIVVITGDIFHDKMNLSTQSLRLCLELFYQLSNRFTTIVIRGNHDGMMDMNIRMDNISGVLYRRNFSNLYYLKYSGVYRFGNILFGVSSLEDNIFTNATVLDEYIIANKITSNLCKIGLYHGMVGTIEISRLYKAKGHYNIDEFTGYDYVLLGDVHKYMFLDENKTIGYPSSLVSQNFTESDEYHGYILWDISNRTTTYNIIQNDYRHKTCKILNNTITIDDKSFDLTVDIEHLTQVIPLNGMIRVDGWDDTKMRLLKSLYTNVRWIKNVKTITSSELSVKSKQNKMKFGSLNLDMKLLIKQCVKRNNNTEITNESIDFIHDIINKEMGNGDLDIINNCWHFQKLSFKNLCIYGGNKEQCLDFKSYGTGKVVLLNGSNGMGKSSILDIICFVLYGRMARDLNMGMKRMAVDILNMGETSGYGELEFELNNSILYRVKRTISKGATGNYTVKCNLYQYENMEYKMILNVGDEVNNFVEGIFGRYDDFLYLNMMRQFDNLSFRKMRQNERKELLVRLLNLERYNKLETKYKAEYKKFSDECNYLNNDLNSVNIVKLKEDIEKTEKLINTDKVLVEEYETKKPIILENIMILDREYVRVDNAYIVDDEKLSNKKMELAILKNKVDEYTAMILNMDVYDNDQVETLNNKMIDNMSKLRKKHDLKKDVIVNGFDNIEYLKELLEIYEDTESISISNWKDISEKYDKTLSSFKKNKIQFNFENSNEYYDNMHTLLLKKYVAYEIKTNLLIKKNDIVNDKVKLLETTLNELNVYVKNVKLLEDDIKYKKSMYEKLTVYEYNENCDKCMKNPRVLELLKVKEEINMLESDVNLLKVKLIDYDTHDKKYRLNKKNYDKSIENIKSLTSQMETIKSELVLYKSYCEYYKLYNNLCKDELEYESYLYLKNEKDLYSNLKIELDELNRDSQFIIENNEIEKENSIINRDIDDLKTKILNGNKYIKYECELFKNRLEYERLNDYVEKCSNQMDSVESNRLIINKRKNIEEELKKLDMNIIKLKSILDNNMVKLHSMNDKLTNYTSKSLDYESKKKSMELYANLVMVLGMNGINLDIIGEYLNSISIYVNDMLSLFMEHKIHLYLDGNDVMMRLINGVSAIHLDPINPINIESDVQPIVEKKVKKRITKKDMIDTNNNNEILLVDNKKKGKSGDVSEVKNHTNNHHNMMMLGGKDSVILDICMMYVLGMMGGINGNMLMLDECLGVFDINSMDKLEYLLTNMLNSYEYIVIISHMSRIHSMIHKTVYVRNDGKYSYLE